MLLIRIAQVMPCESTGRENHEHHYAMSSFHVRKKLMAWADISSHLGLCFSYVSGLLDPTFFFFFISIYTNNQPVTFTSSHPCYCAMVFLWGYVTQTVGKILLRLDWMPTGMQLLVCSRLRKKFLLMHMRFCLNSEFIYAVAWEIRKSPVRHE